MRINLSLWTGRLLALSFLLIAASAQAVDLCQFFKDGNTPSGCSGSLNVSSGGALPTQATAHAMNPSSIPAHRTPFGIEVIGSNVETDSTLEKFNFSLVKGFTRMGAAVSTNPDRTFFSHNYTQSVEGTYLEGTTQSVTAKGFLPTLNIGTAFGIPVGPLKKYVAPSIGLMTRYNRLTGKWGFGGGLNLSSGILSAGFSFLREPEETGGESNVLASGMAGMALGFAHFEYAFLEYMSGPLEAQPAHIMSLSLHFKRLILMGAYKIFDNIENETLHASMGGVQYLFFSFFSAGYMYNYIPGCHSVGVQIFF